MEIKEVGLQIPLTSTSISRIVVEPHNNWEEQQINDPKVNNQLVV